MDAQTDLLQSEGQYDSVKEYYRQVLQKTADLKTDACCTSEKLPPHIKEALLLMDDFSEHFGAFEDCSRPQQNGEQHDKSVSYYL